MVIHLSQPPHFLWMMTPDMLHFDSEGIGVFAFSRLLPSFWSFQLFESVLTL